MNIHSNQPPSYERPNLNFGKIWEVCGEGFPILLKKLRTGDLQEWTYSRLLLDFAKVLQNICANFFTASVEFQKQVVFIPL